MSIAVKSISTHNFAIVPDNVPVIVHIDSIILAKKEGDVKSIVSGVLVAKTGRQTRLQNGSGLVLTSFYGASAPCS